MTTLLVLNGPNLNLLGSRQPEVYGEITLDDIRRLCETKAEELDVGLQFEQSNHEGALIDLIHQARGSVDGIVLNAGAYTHTSVALMDAITSAQVPVVELHLSNVHAREIFRHKSYISAVAVGVICGFGAAGYPLAMTALCSHLSSRL